ncbi:hypothetical protein K439DRAFT_1616844 [Ramaria rubella]|nr:hypothetical protein K439DRAFT_1616844 [Ramaria rubella]
MASQYGLTDMELDSDPDSSETSMDDEYTAYILSLLAQGHIDLVNFWDMNQVVHPTFFEMAIQASAVPCVETLTAWHNHIKLPLMEALQMLIYSGSIGFITLMIGSHPRS